jgi:hypothetical protein
MANETPISQSEGLLLEAYGPLEMARLIERSMTDATNPTVGGERIADLELALDLALDWLGEREPGDSRVVSDEFVAMAAIRCEANTDLEECREIIRAAITKATGDNREADEPNKPSASN